jgi:hypothetical protein
MPARLYLGVAAQGRNPKVIMRKVWLAPGAGRHRQRGALQASLPNICCLIQEMHEIGIDTMFWAKNG